MTLSLSGKRVLVIGLGLHGGAIGTITWLAQQGAIITVTDKKTEEELAESVAKLSSIPNITYHLGGHTPEDVAHADLIIRNPAVPRTSELLTLAREKNIPVAMDSSLFFEHSPSKHVIGITGSKGKTTCSTAIATVLSTINSKTVAVGIDGVSPLGMLNAITPESPVVFELSSWRLEALGEIKRSPHIAVVTSIYRDHLNTYESFEEYIATKKIIITNQTAQDIAILNADDEILRTWEADVPSTLYWFSTSALSDKQGIWIESGMIIARLTSENISLCPLSDIPHTSDHELRNKLPALFIALLEGASPEQAVAALQTMKPLMHRLQLVRTHGGVRYINDSAATMPDAAIAALKAIQTPLIMILGGSDKALIFHDLAKAISTSSVQQLIWLPGTATDRMKEEILPHVSIPSIDASSMEEAVTLASAKAQEGDSVLLSPGATSFGLFLHEFDRGNAFITAVENLK